MARKINARIFKHQVLLFRGNFRNPCSLSNADPLPPPSPHPRLSGDWGTREKRERGMMGTSVEHERGVMGKRRERGERPFAFSPLPITPFVPAFLDNFKLKYHPVIAGDWGRGRT